MVPFMKEGKESIGFNEFKKKLIETTENARNNKHILAHCILLYKRSNPYITKILSDHEYYDSLNEVSGRFVNIYHIDTNIQNGIDLPREMNLYTDTDEYYQIEKDFRNVFEINDQHTAMLIFLNIQDKEIIEYIVCKVNERSLDGTFLYLKGLVEKVVTSIKEVEKENFDNRDVIFHLQQIGIGNYKRYNALKLLIPPFLKILEFIWK